jgi:general secretion pathway protein J
MSCCTSKGGRGFTLLELLVALAIFAIMAVMAYSGLHSVLQASARLEQEMQRLAEVQTAFTLFSRDAMQAFPRPIRNEWGDPLSALAGDATSLEFTRAGWNNPLNQPRSNLQRVAYRLENREFYRLYWNVLDRAQDSRPERILLLGEVHRLRLRYRDQGGQWHDQWPPDPRLLAAGMEADSLILTLLEITLTVPEWGDLIRLIEIPPNLKPPLPPAPPAEAAPPGPSTPAQAPETAAPKPAEKQEE